MSMTIESLDKLEALKAKATPGEWCKHYGAAGGGVVRRWRDELGRRCTRFVLEVHLNAIGGEERQSADADLVIALRNSASDLFDLAREALRLRQLIEDAPHDENCEYIFYLLRRDANGRRLPDAACNCWKAQFITPSRDMAADKETS